MDGAGKRAKKLEKKALRGKRVNFDGKRNFNDAGVDSEAEQLQW